MESFLELERDEQDEALERPPRVVANRPDSSACHDRSNRVPVTGYRDFRTSFIADLSLMLLN